MAYSSTVGRVMRRDDGFRYDWIVSDGLFQFGAEKIVLESPFFYCPEYGGEWKMTLHHMKQELNYPTYSSISVYVANKDCVGKGGYKCTVGLVDKDGKDFCLGSDHTSKNGMCVIECSKDRDSNWFSVYEKQCRGRFIVYCKFGAEDGKYSVKNVVP